MTTQHPLATDATLLEQVAAWVECNWLRAIDQQLAVFFQRDLAETCPLVLLAAALASHQLGRGHVCLDLTETLENPNFGLSMPPEGADNKAALSPSALLADVTLAQWQAALQGSRLVQQGAAAGNAPLVLSDNLLYLRRYWDCEQRVARQIRTRLDRMTRVPETLQPPLNALFPSHEVGGSDWQKVACALAASGRFTLITGGPGTGKTTTVVRLLALLQEQALQATGHPLRIRLAAPTGKAAARLTESIGAQLASSQISDEVRQHIRGDVVTLHRLLGSRPDSRKFMHHAGHLLPLDVLVIDEGSMIDLSLMDSVLDALPPQARLILLGDKDQLASVDAGSVLGDLCRDAEHGYYSDETLTWLRAASGQPLQEAFLQPGRQALAQRTVMLRYSRRFGPDSGIGQLANAVNRCAVHEARGLLKSFSFNDLQILKPKEANDARFQAMLLQGRLPASTADATIQGYAHYLTVMNEERPAAHCSADAPEWEAWAAKVLRAFDQFRLLCVVRHGAWGVSGMNEQIQTLLQRKGLLGGHSEQTWFEGRPVLVTRNDYGLGLMNGDIGIALRMPKKGSVETGSSFGLRVCFPRNDGSGTLNRVLPSRLNNVETVFAMTVHKSQGSEFEHAALVLPETINPVLTKELIYTAITRAKRCFSLIEPRPEVLDEAVKRAVSRRSGLLPAMQVVEEA